MKLRILTLCILVFCLWSPVKAQYTQVGNGAFVGLDNSPLATVSPSPFFNKTAYVYPSGSVANLNHGDTIRGISFLRDGTDSLRDPVLLRIWLRNVPYAAFDSGALNWDSLQRVSGTVKVFDGSPKQAVGHTFGWAYFAFDSGVYHVFDTSQGTHLQLMMHYAQTINQPDTIQWYMESQFSIPYFNSVNEAKYLYGNSSRWNDSLTIGSSYNKPTVRFHHPGDQEEAEVRDIFALHRVPLRMGRADTVRVWVENTGADTLFSYPFYLSVAGVNTFRDTLWVDTLPPLEQKLIGFGGYQPVNQGYEELTVSCPNDAINSNNQRTISRTVTYETYSHFNALKGGSGGGIGFGSGTGEMVARFYAGGPRTIRRVQVDFNRNNVPFQLLIYQAGANGLPDSLLYQTQVIQTLAGPRDYILDSAVTVSGDYYVGLRQVSATSINVRFQYERPIRPHTFYYAEVGSSDWEDFYPYVGYNWGIHPHLEIHNDVAVTRIIFPTEGMSMRYSLTDSLVPRVGFKNHGLQDQDSLLARLTIKNVYGQQLYESTRFLDLASDSSMAIDFDPFSRYNIGTFTMEAEIFLATDSVQANNFYTHDFELFKDHDVSVGRIFEPAYGDTFEVFTEGFWPQIRIVNLGKADQNAFPVIARLLKDSVTIDSQRMLVSLEGYNSTIIVFDSIFPSQGGNLTFEVYTDLYRDSFRVNDTLRVPIYSRVGNDVSLDLLLKPFDGQRLGISSKHKPFVQIRNEGFNAQDSAWVYARISDTQGNELYLDSVLRAISEFSIAQCLFSEFTCPATPQQLRFEAWVLVKGDLFFLNNAKSGTFEVVYSRDLHLDRLLHPVPNALFRLGQGPDSLRFTVVNDGLLDAANVPFMIQHRLPDGRLELDSVFLSSLAPGDTAILQLDSLKTPVAGTYGLRIWNAWDQDQQRSSADTLRATYIVMFARDLAILQHVRPVDSVYNLRDSLQIRIRVANLGADSAKQASVVVQIVDDQQFVLRTDTMDVPYLGSGDEVDLAPDPDISGLPSGRYQLRSWLEDNDDRTSNDSFQSSFTYRVIYDAAIDSVIRPSADGTLRYRYTHQPALLVSNRGERALDSVQVHAQVVVSGDPIYERTKIIALDSGQQLLVLLDSNLRYPEAAAATALFWISHPWDAVDSNDRISFSFSFSEQASILKQTAVPVKVSPNPFSDQLMVESALPMDRIIARDPQGRAMAEVRPQATRYSWPTDWVPGLYHLEIWCGEVRYSIKVIKVD